MGSTDGPRLPIQPEDLPKVRELLTAEEYAALLKRLDRVATAGQQKGRPEGRPRATLVLRWLNVIRLGCPPRAD